MRTSAPGLYAAGVIAYALGIVFALVGLQFGRPKLWDSLHDVFE
jgi:thioredoxin reductase